MKRTIIDQWLLLAICLVASSNYLIGQTENTGLDLGFYTIMVVPYVEADELISERLTADKSLRNAIKMVESKLIDLDLQVYDFTARYEQYLLTEEMKGSDRNERSDFLAYAAPDMYCEIDIQDKPCSGDEHQAELTAKVYLTATGRLIHTWQDHSNCFVAAAPYSSLQKRVVGKLNVSFRDRLLGELEKMDKYGQSLSLNFNLGEGQRFDLEDDFLYTGKLNLGDGDFYLLVTSWLDELTDLVSYYKTIGQTEELIRLDDLRIPLIDEQSGGFFPISKFKNKLNRFIRQLEWVNDGGENVKLKASITDVNGQIIISLKEK